MEDKNLSPFEAIVWAKIAASAVFAGQTWEHATITASKLTEVLRDRTTHSVRGELDEAVTQGRISFEELS